MATKIFVSYKYGDRDVSSLQNELAEIFQPTTVRTYVDKLEEYFDKTEFAIYKGESNDEDLSHLSDDTIWEILKNRIYDSSVTIVLISPNMKEPYHTDRSQWIPWEISYSLKETTRNDRTSHSNALLAVVLPSRGGTYDYYLKSIQCGNCSCTLYEVNTLFDILRCNMLNQKNKVIQNCNYGNSIYLGEHSYIKNVKWSDFIKSPKFYINTALEIKNKIDEYIIRKEI